MATVAHTPVGRGFTDSLYFYHHANNYYDCGVELESTGEINACLNNFADLSEANRTMDAPRGFTPLAALRSQAAAKGDDELAYVENILRERAVRRIEEHEPSVAPLLLFYSFHLVHTPMQVPSRYLRLADERVEAAGGGYVCVWMCVCMCACMYV